MKASVPAWLTSTWEANWHSFQYFLFARFLFGALCLLGLVFPGQWNVQLALPPSPTLFTLFILFLLLSLMAWIAGKVLRSLFPDKFKGKVGKA